MAPPRSLLRGKINEYKLIRLLGMLSSNGYNALVRVDENHRQPSFLRRNYYLSHTVTNRAVIVVDSQQYVRMIQHILISGDKTFTPVILPDNEMLCAVRDQEA